MFLECFRQHLAVVVVLRYSLAIKIQSCPMRVRRKPEFSRPKPENIERLNRLKTDPMADVHVEKPSSERVTTASGGFKPNGFRSRKTL